MRKELEHVWVGLHPGEWPDFLFARFPGLSLYSNTRTRGGGA